MITTRALVIGLAGVAMAAFGTGRAVAQTAPPALGSLRTPPSPAFSLLGIEPSAVERPATPADAAVAVVNRFRDGAVPKNFAFEASPYWLKVHPDLTWRADARRSIGQSIARTASLSLGTAETGTDAAPATSLAFGFRTLIVSGRLSQESQTALEKVEETLRRQSEIMNGVMKSRGLDKLLDQVLAKEITREEYDRLTAALALAATSSDEYRQQSQASLKDVANKRDGFALELAAGAMWDFAKGDWEARQFRQRAIWLTPSYERGPWTALGVVRYIDDSKVPNEDALDWGGRAIFSTADYTFSLEYVERAPNDPTDVLKRSHRLVGVAEYRVSSGTWLVASFGKDRQKGTSTAETLVAQLGLSFSFSKDRYKFEN
jgi:hypothetical protein